MRKFGAIYADPPWRFEARSKKGEGRSPKYRRMTLDQIKALPVADWAKRDCVLFLWVLDCMLPQALELIEAWGFTYKTVGFVWGKTTKRGKFHFGLGYWTRCGTEQCLIATRGRPKRVSAGVAQFIASPRRDHSRKPDEVRDRIRKLVKGPYLEMFARETVPGWTPWGNEIDKFNKERKVHEHANRNDSRSRGNRSRNSTEHGRRTKRRSVLPTRASCGMFTG